MLEAAGAALAAAHPGRVLAVRVRRVRRRPGAGPQGGRQRGLRRRAAALQQRRRGRRPGHLEDPARGVGLGGRGEPARRRLRRQHLRARHGRRRRGPRREHRVGGRACTPPSASASTTPPSTGSSGLSEALRGELRGTGVGVTCLCPELVDTLVFESTRNAPAHLGLPAPGPHPDGRPRGDDGHHGHAAGRGRRAGGRGHRRAALLGAHPRRHRAAGAGPQRRPRGAIGRRPPEGAS